jgi:AraC-like DNA-binding protein
LIDGAGDFNFELSTGYKMIVVQFPRDAIGQRHCGLFNQLGRRLSSTDPGTQMVAQMAMNVASRLFLLSPISRSYAFDAMLTLLGALPQADAGRRSVAEHRLERAFVDIDAHLGNPDLSADMIAAMQGISRRRLDSIFAERGLSMERVIWSRRLERAASEISDPNLQRRRLIEVAVAWGFSSEPHFSRRFRLRFGMPPGEYRRRALADARMLSVPDEATS